MVKLLVGLVASLFVASAAQAADIFREDVGQTIDAPHYGKFSWSGVVLGGRIGWLDGTHEFESDEFDASFNGLSMQGLIGGGEVGIDRQIDRIVLGIFATYDFTDVDSTVSYDGDSARLSKDDAWSIGLKAGVLATDRTLIYGKAAYAETTYEAKFDGPSVDDGERTLDGFALGAGIESAIAPSTTIGLETTYTMFDEENIGPIVVESNELAVLATLRFRLNENVLGF